ncbi:uncharacterized protein [Aegilops tauschii subsp. strangulata]|uniref:uncharacterized protein n=1 Tax=Aegilops tauschii subsp. strangulata TaxID=200361 RepID=UPI00098AD7EB
MVMAAGTTAAAFFAGITFLFRDNQQARAGYLGQKFCNILQGDKTVTAYCLEQKMVADALADVNAPVSDDALVWNTIKGLNDHYKDISNLAPLIKPFPTFLEFRNMLLLQELKSSSQSSTSPAVFYSAPANGGPRGGSAPPPPQPAGLDAPAPYGAPTRYGTFRYKGKKKKKTWGGGAPIFPNMQNPWTGAIHMYPMMGPGMPTHGHAGPVSILGPRPRPSAPLHRPPAHGYMALPTPSPPTPQATYSYTGYPAYGSSAQTWDPSALASYFNTMSLEAPTEWLMDTGAAAHMSSDAGNLTSLSSPPPHQHVIVGDGSSIPVTHSGHVRLPTSHHLTLRDVLITPRIVKNLISVCQFTTDNYCSVEFDPWGFSVKDLWTGCAILRCNSSGDLYLLTTHVAKI